MKLLHFPSSRIVGDLPAMLRNLADQVERGDYGEPHALAWVMDLGSPAIEVGLMGQAAEAGPTAYLLLGLGQRKLEGM